MARILPNDRLLFVGSTRSGKSTIGTYFFSRFRVQRVFIDPKGEWRIKGAVTVRSPRELEQALRKQPVIRYVPARDDVAEWEAVYALLFEWGKATKRGLYIHTDEVDSVGNQNKYPRGLRLIEKQGAGLGIGHGKATQRPVEIPRVMITEVTHIFVVAPALSADDLANVAREMRMPVGELEDRVAQLPQYGFLWWDRREDELATCPPLNDAMRRSSGARADKFDPHAGQRDQVDEHQEHDDVDEQAADSMV